MNYYYILNDKKEAVPCDFETFGEYFLNNCRKVAFDKVGDIKISTVFLGIDHSASGSHPLIFETMVFGGNLDDEMSRYSTWDEAEKGHAEMVKRVKDSISSQVINEHKS